MTETRDYIQKTTDQVLENVGAAQAATISTVGFLARAAQKVTAQTPLAHGKGWSEAQPKASAIVDDVYDAFEKLIANQREFGQQLVAAMTPVAQDAPVEPAAKPAPATKRK